MVRPIIKNEIFLAKIFASSEDKPFKMLMSVVISILLAKLFVSPRIIPICKS